MTHLVWCWGRGTLSRVYSNLCLRIVYILSNCLWFDWLAYECKWQNKLLWCPFQLLFKRSVCCLYSLMQLIIQSFALGSNDWNTKGGWYVFLFSLFFGFINVKSICLMFQNWSIYFEAIRWIIGCLHVVNPCTEEWHCGLRLLHILVNLDKGQILLFHYILSE